ncbi:MAG TPA: sigma-70 family RNA polymerase sigma factor [Solirubrobacteraceae bacterium]|nr:sigma-70 family RNA polymerase sigma factor [Solirubrobacteraceae bacterium]
MDASPIVAGRAPASGMSVPVGLFGDERLARLVAHGSERAFAAIYDRYHHRLYRYCRSIVRDDADAHDALQSTLASAFVALKRGQRDAPLRPWLFRIAHNEAISLIRRRTGDVELAEAPEQWVGSAEDRAGERARLALLVADLHELPERQRGALVMRELSGLSHEEIALALGTSVGTAKQAIFEARGALMEFAEGRSMVCEDVRRTVSDGDGRALRGRRVRAHLRDCAPCAAFTAAIPGRREDLQALVPVLAPVASAAMLGRVMGAGSGHGAGGGAGAVAVGAAGKTLGATLAAKALLGAAVLVTAAGSVTVVRSVLTPGHQAARASGGVRHSATTPGGVARRAVQPATGARAFAAGRLGASNVRGAARAAGAGSSTSAQSAGGASTGAAGVPRGVAAAGALPSQTQGTPARSGAGSRRSGSSPGVGKHVGAARASPGAAHHGPAGGSHSSGAGGSRTAAGGGAGSPPVSTPATPGPPAGQGVAAVPGSQPTTPAPSSPNGQISPSAHVPSGTP